MRSTTASEDVVADPNAALDCPEAANSADHPKMIPTRSSATEPPFHSPPYCHWKVHTVNGNVAVFTFWNIRTSLQLYASPNLALWEDFTEGQRMFNSFEDIAAELNLSDEQLNFNAGFHPSSDNAAVFNPGDNQLSPSLTPPASLTMTSMASSPPTTNILRQVHCVRCCRLRP